MADESPSLSAVVEAAFHETHNGRSPDDVVIDDGINAAFVAACQKTLPDVTPGEANWQLFNLRKKGLGKVTTASQRDDHKDYLHAAEIAARHMEDKYGQTIDRVFCDPVLRVEFDRIAECIAPDISTYLLRKAAQKLRKARRLQPELIKRVTDWGTQVSKFPAPELVQNLDLLPRLPGVYIFSDKSGYLYIGEGGSLRARVAKHLDHSDRKNLAQHLWTNGLEDLTVEIHAFRKDCDGNKVGPRKAYESELIKSRNPRFNIHA